MKKIIIKMPSFIGDTLMTFPAMELLRKEYPNCELTVVCKKNCIDLFRKKGITKIIIDDTKSNEKNRIKETIKLVKKLREEEYDLGVLFHNTFVDALIFKLAKIDTLIGYEKEKRKILLDYFIKIDRTRHYVNHYAILINSYLAYKYKELPPMKLYSEKFKINIKSGKKNIAFALGGENKDFRAYPLDLSLKLFELLKDEDFNIILLGDKNDKKNNDIYEEYLKKSNKNVFNFSGKTSLSEHIDLISSVDLLITIDTSSMHIATATNTNFIVLVGKGSSAFSTVYPKGNYGKIIFEGEHCINDEDLIKAINPQKIKEEIKNFLI